MAAIYMFSVKVRDSGVANVKTITQVFEELLRI